MKKYIFSAIALAMAVTAFGQDPQLPAAYAPTNKASIIAFEFLPSIPFGWVIVAEEPLISNGSTVAVVQVFLFNPTTRQHAVWLVQM